MATRSSSFPVVATTLTMVALATLCAAAPAQVRYDDFDGVALDDRLWGDIYAPSPGWVSGGLLQISSPNTVAWPWVFAAQDFRGDVDLILDWQNFQPTGNGWSDAQLEFGSFPDGNHIYYMMRSSGSGPDEIGFFGQVNGISTGSFSTPSNATAGRFKITRVGNQIDGYYDVGSGWTHLGTFPGVFTSDVRVSIGAHNVNLTAFDYLDYSGTPVHPSPDVQINGTDGPLTVQAGTPLDVTLALEANTYAGQPAAEFVVALRPNAPMLWFRGALGWLPSAAPTAFRNGPLVSAGAASIMTSSAVPPGTYQLYYAILPTSGVDDLRADSVLLSVQ